MACVSGFHRQCNWRAYLGRYVVSNFPTGPTGLNYHVAWIGPPGLEKCAHRNSRPGRWESQSSTQRDSSTKPLRKVHLFT
jgi:hypothetical protein